MVINRISSKVFFITVTKAGEEVDLDVEQVKLPVYSLTRVQQLYADTEQAIVENDRKLAALAEKDIPALKEALKELQSNIEFSKVVLSTEQAVFFRQGIQLFGLLCIDGERLFAQNMLGRIRSRMMRIVSSTPMSCSSHPLMTRIPLPLA